MFQGRLTRTQFALAQCLVLATLTAGAFFVLSFEDENVQGILAIVLFFGLALVSFSTHVRRLHDMDWSAWWMLLNFIPVLSFIFFITLLIGKSVDVDNHFGVKRKGYSLTGLLFNQWQNLE